MEENKTCVEVGAAINTSESQPILMENFDQFEQELMNGHENFIMCYETHKKDPETKVVEVGTLKMDAPFDKDDPMSFVLAAFLFANPRVRILKV